MKSQIWFNQSTAHPASRTLTAEEASAVSGGLICCISPDMFWRYPLPHPIAPMPPKAVVVPLDPPNLMSPGSVPDAQ
ncbi:hypothetical protein [Noviherbaspirillum sp.]|uniref:hypothetical protein n=1 Tax=Noviherbaspirillum sp. TaxID=1926288 RepID=UPI002FDF98DB